jgi:transposase-like protein
MNKQPIESPRTLQDAIQYFSDEQVCIDAVAAQRWPNGVACPACEGKAHYYLATQKRWKCRSCNRQFSVKLGTIFEASPIPLTKWMLAIWMLSNCKNGVSSYEISSAIGITQKSAWFMLHRIRFAMKAGSFAKMNGPVECDETFVGANPQKMHKSRRIKINAIMANNYGINKYAAGKTAVHGILDRETRKVRASVIPTVKRATLQERILNSVAHGATVYTDELPSYKFALAENYIHEIITHSKEYVRGQVHTNGIENFWSLLKRGLRGTYVAVEPFHLDRYIDEQAWRFNNRKDETNTRKLSDMERFNNALSGIAGKRLTYAEVTGK